MKKIASVLALILLCVVSFSQTNEKWYVFKFINSTGEKQKILFKGLSEVAKLQSHLNGGVAFVETTSFFKKTFPVGTNLSKTVSLDQFVSMNVVAMTLFREIQNQSHGQSGFLSIENPNVFAVSDGEFKRFIQVHWNSHYQGWVLMSFDVDQNITVNEKDILLFTGS